MSSYSEYFGDLDPWFTKNVGEDFIKYRNQINNILQEESKLMEIVKLIGSDVLPDDQKLIIEIARVIRVGFLQQNAFHPDDTFVPLEKQKLMMKVILHLYQKAKQLVAASVPLSGISESGLFDKLVKMKYDIPNNKPEMFDDYITDIDNTVAAIVAA
jgi:V/A-type H+-transporting ATPase subunit A